MSYAQRIEGGKKVKLAHYKPDENGGLLQAAAETKTKTLGLEMQELLDLLYEAGRHSLLIVLQGRDTSGKDGTVRNLLTYCNAQSCRIIPFKVPTPQELAHDFLWRIHAQTPEKGSIAVFNRSHYEDVLVVRVHDLVPEKVWRRRYAHINHFESLLVDANTIVLKFYLHISKEEQETRLYAREQDVTKSWKLSVSDWKERELWNDYTKAYEDALSECSTAAAPWYLIPANHKWYRNLAVTEQIVKTLRPYKKEWIKQLTALGEQEKKALAEYRATAAKPDKEKE